MKRSEHRILTTHVGAFPAAGPARGLRRGANTGRGPSDWKRYEEILRRSIAEVVKQQAAAGIDIVNDGEVRQEQLGRLHHRAAERFRGAADQLRPIEWLGRDRERFADFIAEKCRA
jgi:5-methyltetrahydropteroyltriglutamate--homocysteine methyltransferase